MPYIGRGPAKSGAFRILDDFSLSFDGSTTTFALTVNSTALTVGLPETLIIAVDGVIQEPGTGFTISGSNIVFGSAPQDSATFWGVELGDVGGIADNIVDGKITTAKLVDDAVTYAKMQNLATADRVLGSTSTGLIGEVQIVPDMLASDAVTTVKILDANVTLAKIANQAANTILVRDASSSGVVSAKAVTDTQILIGDGTGFTAAALSGEATMTNAGVVSIAGNIIDEANLKSDNGPTDDHVLTAKASAAGGLTWAAAGGVALGGNTTNNNIVTVTDSDTLNGEANLTFDGANLYLINSATSSSSNLMVNSSATSTATPARLILRVGAGNTGDAFITFHNQTGGGAEWAFGLDNTDSNKIKLGYGGTVDSNTILTVNTTGMEGIKFAPTNVVSTNVNTFDDYEEGSWTATFQEAGNDNTNASMVHTYGQYTKMGNRVFISFWAKSSSLVNVAGSMTIVGLPFPVKSGAQYYSTCDIGHASGLGTSNAIAAYFEPTTSLITLREWGGSDGTTNLTDGELSNDGALMGMGHYITTS